MGQTKVWEAFEAGANRTRDLPRRFKWLRQRFTRGYADPDIWDLDRTIVEFVYPRLKHFVTWQCEHGKSCPVGLDPSTWLEILRKMERAFELLHEDGFVFEKEEKEIKEGLELFAKYLPDLWD